MEISKPKVRLLNYEPYQQNGETLYILQDPWQVAERGLLVHPLLAQATLYCDGRHTAVQILDRLERDTGVALPLETLMQSLAQLDEAFLLDNDRSRQAIAQARAAYRAQPFRPPALANDLNYPSTAEALAPFLDGYFPSDGVRPELANWHGRAVVSPHIDYQRGGAVYAQTWRYAEAAVQAADLVLMFATDHRGGLGSVTLSAVPYATPYGVLPTDEALVGALATAVGEQFAYELELNHRQEHAVELAAVWLHHALRGQEPPAVVPLLIGSFHHFVSTGGHPRGDERLNGFVEALVRETAGRRVLCVASVDLAHVGPVFDDDFVMDGARREALRVRDASLMSAVLAGEAERFYSEIAAIEDADKVCGFSPLYLMMRYLHGREPDRPFSGHHIAYAQCDADSVGESLVSIGGLLVE